jgi:hypothetical protein
MKNSIFRNLMVLIALAAFASPVLADEGDATNGTWKDPTDMAAANLVIDDGSHGPGLTAADLKFSANVIYVYEDDDDTGATFAMATFNTKGTKAYASNSESSKIYSTTSSLKGSTAADIEVTLVQSGDWDSSEWSEVGK